VTLCCEYIILIDQKLIIKEKIQILAPAENSSRTSAYASLMGAYPLKKAALRFSEKETVLMIFQLHRCYVPDARKSSFHFGILIKGINH